MHSEKLWGVKSTRAGTSFLPWNKNCICYCPKSKWFNVDCAVHTDNPLRLTSHMWAVDWLRNISDVKYFKSFLSHKYDQARLALPWVGREECDRYKSCWHSLHRYTHRYRYRSLFANLIQITKTQKFKSDLAAPISHDKFHFQKILNRTSCWLPYPTRWRRPTSKIIMITS